MTSINKTWLTLILVAGLGLSACARVHVVLSTHQPGKYIYDPSEVPAELPRCSLVGSVNRQQETGYWCWAASTQMVIEYLTKPTPPFADQCHLVNFILKDELAAAQTTQPAGVVLDCCKAVDKNTNLGDPSVLPSRAVCVKQMWPQRVLTAYGFTYGEIIYDPPGASPRGPTWEELTTEICEDRPFIFVVGWVGGGRHTSVIGGYRQTADTRQFVEVYDHSNDDFVVMTYDAFLGVPRDFVHDRDYVYIRPGS